MMPNRYSNGMGRSSWIGIHRRTARLWCNHDGYRNKNQTKRYPPPRQIVTGRCLEGPQTLQAIHKPVHLVGGRSPGMKSAPLAEIIRLVAGSQTKFAKMTGIARATLGRALDREPSPDKVAQIETACRRFGYRVAWRFGDTVADIAPSVEIPDIPKIPRGRKTEYFWSDVVVELEKAREHLDLAPDYPVEARIKLAKAIAEVAAVQEVRREKLRKHDRRPDERRVVYCEWEEDSDQADTA